MGLVTGRIAIRLGIPLILLFIVVLTVVIISGRILGQINKSASNCRTDENIENAKNLTGWIVALSSTTAALILLGLIALFVLMFVSPV